MEALKFAVVKDNICINVIGSMSLEEAEKFSGEKCYLIPNPPFIDLNTVINNELFAKIQASSVGINWTYDESKNKFTPPQPYPSWVLNDENMWLAPIPQPNKDGYYYVWNEEKKSWDPIQIDPNLMG
jgi:hypothetical protein